MRTPTASFLLGACLMLAACGSQPPPAPAAAARPVVELARWQVRDGDRALGNLIHYEIRDPDGPVRFYQVVDQEGHILGSATEQGRFSRRVPFRENEQDLGVWSLARGTAKLFEAKADVELRPVVVDASAKKERP